MGVYGYAKFKKKNPKTISNIKYFSNQHVFNPLEHKCTSLPLPHRPVRLPAHHVQLHLGRKFIIWRQRILCQNYWRKDRYVKFLYNFLTIYFHKSETKLSLPARDVPAIVAASVLIKMEDLHSNGRRFIIYGKRGRGRSQQLSPRVSTHILLIH